MFSRAKKSLFAGVKVFVTDFDGVHTDGKVIVDQDGRESVVCSRRDGLAFDMLRKAGIPAYVISKETNKVVAARASKLGIEYHHGVSTGAGKRDILQDICRARGVDPKAVAYMGDDVNDLEALSFVGLPISVADGHPKARRAAAYVTEARGGDHAIREAVELILNAQGNDASF